MFHLTKKPASAQPADVHIRVKNGFHPDTVHAVAGEPTRLTFRRDEGSPCSETVVFPSLGKRLTLPRGRDVTIELLPEHAGEVEFACEMGMLRGRLVVSAPAVTAS